MSDCNCKNSGGVVYKALILALLLLNTFFIGSMWCAAVKSGGCPVGKGAYCPLGMDKGGAKICPITGKVLSAPEATGTPVAK